MNPGQVRLRCADPPLNVVAWLGADPVSISGGMGGWTITSRPRQVAMTTWAGVEPLQVNLPLLFDGWVSDTGQELALRRLLTVARGDSDSPPGRVTVTGIPLPAKTWVIENIDYGDVIVRPADMKRVRQALTLTLREYVPPTYLKLRKRALQGARSKTKVITTRKGDTPAKVARRSSCKWTDLRTLNPKLVKKANQALKISTKLRVPVKAR